MAEELSMQEQSELQRQFHAIDTHHSGSISFEEFFEAMKYNLPLQSSRASEMFMRLANARSNGHMEISYSEFVAASLRSRAWADDEVCRAAFQRLDENADGHINVLDQPMSPSTASGISSIIRDATGSSDGSISYQEFVSYV